MIKYISTLLLALSLFSLELDLQKPLQELIVESSSQWTQNGKQYDYRIVAGTLVLKDEQGKDKGSVFYTAYFLKGTPSSERPITYCFNGGPGAASVWLNTGLFGPKCIEGADIVYANPPYSLIDNEDSLLDLTDLVFIDPVSTGVSQAAPGADLKTLYSVDEDVQMMTDFIRLFTLKYKRWDSPKYIAAESYGGMRAAKVGYKLHDEHALYLNGLIFISAALDLQTIWPDDSNDLPYILYLPSFTAVALYHQMIPADTQIKDAEEFAKTQYASSLFTGDALSREEKKALALKLKAFTGLDEAMIERSNFRIHPSRFIKELMQKKGQVLGRFDGRILGIDNKGNEFYAEYDPSLEAVFGAVTATYNQFLAKDLKWQELKEYRALLSLTPWNWGKANHYASALPELKRLIAQNPKLQIYSAYGLYDLAIPFNASSYALNHLGLNEKERARIHSHEFKAGHMMYFNHEIRHAIKQQISTQFFQ